jgi:hypothetical protein
MAHHLRAARGRHALPRGQSAGLRPTLIGPRWGPDRLIFATVSLARAKARFVVLRLFFAIVTASPLGLETAPDQDPPGAIQKCQQPVNSVRCLLAYVWRGARDAGTGAARPAVLVVLLWQIA